MDLRKIIIISSPEIDERNEVDRLSFLMESYPFARLHIRKPQATLRQVAAFIEALPSQHRHRYVVSEHGELLSKYGLGGLHLSRKSWQSLKHRPMDLPTGCIVGLSCHSAEELASLPFRPDYAYLSPVAKSLSKEAYLPRLSEMEMRKLCAETPFELIALGGLSPSNAARLIYLGFGKLAMLGYWSAKSIEEAKQKAKAMEQAQLLIAAGLAPTGEAGLSADLRYCASAQAKAYALASCLTSQNAQQFQELSPVSDSLLGSQIESLSKEAPAQTIKIGLLSSMTQAKALVGKLRSQYPESLIVWDPILSSSTGKQFHDIYDLPSLLALAKEFDLLTPNRAEAEMMLQMSGKESFAEMAQAIGCDLVVKSYAQNEQDEIIDAVFRKDATTSPLFIPINAVGEERHGTGCLYSTAIAIALANGVALETAVAKAQSAVAAYRLGMNPCEAFAPRTKALLQGGRMFITHAETVAETVRQVQCVLRHGLADSVQVRMKEACFEDQLEAAKAIKGLCRLHNVAFIINDSVDLARIVAADGVHLGKEDLHPNVARKLLGDTALIGLTCNTEGDLFRANRLDIDYIGLGPYRHSSTKKKLAPTLGKEGYRRLCHSLREQGAKLPAFAIGGIQLDEINRLLTTGISGVALSSSLIAEIKKIEYENN